MATQSSMNFMQLFNLCWCFLRYYPQTDIKHQANDFILFLLCFTINFLHDLILFRNFFLFFCPAFADKLTDIHQRKKWLWQIGPREFRL